MTQSQKVANLLMSLERALVRSGHASTSPPSKAQLASTTPFFADTMPLSMWLQWVLIPRLNALITEKAPLPNKVAIAPMAEQAMPGEAEIIAILTALDEALSQ